MHSDEDKTIFSVCARALIDSEKKIYTCIGMTNSYNIIYIMTARHVLYYYSYDLII